MRTHQNIHKSAVARDHNHRNKLSVAEQLLFFGKSTGALRVVICVAVVTFAFSFTETKGQQPDKGTSELPDVSKQITLQKVLQYAALQNQRMKRYWQEWQAEKEEITSAKTLPDPKLSYGYFIRSVETRVGPQEQKFGVKQKFPWFGTLDLKGKKARKEAEAARERYVQAKLHLFYKVKAAYYGYYYLGQAIDVTKENIELLKQLESVARTRYEGGGNLPPVVRAQVEIGKLEDKLATLKDMRSPRTARLNAAMNRPPDAPLPWPDTLPSAKPIPSKTELQALLDEQNPALKRLDLLKKKADIGVDLADKQFYPDFSVGVNYVDTSGAVMSGVDDSSKDPVMAKVSISLPIWRSKYKADKKAAEARREAMRKKRTNRKRELEATLTNTLFKYNDAERKIDLYRDTLIPKVRQELNVSRDAFEAGEADFLNLIDTERSLLQFRLSYQKARTERLRQLAKIEMLTGRTLRSGKSKNETKSNNKK